MSPPDFFSSLRQAVHEAWEFLVPPIVRLALAAVVFFLVLPVAPLGPSELLVLTTADQRVQNVVESLESLKLQALVPVGILLAFIIIAYVSNRLMLAIASLVPLKVELDSPRLAASRLRFFEIWRYYPEKKKPGVILTAMETMVGRSSTGEVNSSLFSLARVREKLAAAAQRTAYIKFLMLFSLASWITGWFFYGNMIRTLPQLVGLLFVTAALLLISFAIEAHYLREELLGTIEAAYSMLASGPDRAVSESHEHYEFLLEYQRQKGNDGKAWWRIAPARLPLFEIFGGYKWRRPNPAAEPGGRAAG